MRAEAAYCASCGKARFVVDHRSLKPAIEAKAMANILEAPDLALMMHAAPATSQRFGYPLFVAVFFIGRLLQIAELSRGRRRRL